MYLSWKWFQLFFWKFGKALFIAKNSVLCVFPSEKSRTSAKTHFQTIWYSRTSFIRTPLFRQIMLIGIESIKSEILSRANASNAYEDDDVQCS